MMAEGQDAQALSGVLKDLGGGLILRRATREDAEAVAAFFDKRAPRFGGGV